MTETNPCKERTETIIIILSLIALLAFTLIIFVSINSKSIFQFYSTLGIGILLAMGVFIFGTLIGFLFGIPKTLQGSDSGGTNSEKGDNGIGESKSDHYQPNTNLEQMSDWLTKILVGVGLTQLTKIPSLLQYFASIFSPALGGSPYGDAISITIFIFFSIDGFLIGYLWTRRYFEYELTITDFEISEFRKLESYKDDKERIRKNDEIALELTQKILYPGKDDQPIDMVKYTEAMKGASVDMLRLIFYKAENVRWENRTRDKKVMERTEKIFRALIECDPKDMYHKNHGHLGFVLKDKEIPNNIEAIKEFTTAIKIRGPWYNNNYLYYEFCRAVCTILEDEGYNKKTSSSNLNKSKIINDIVAAATDKKILDIMSNNTVIKEWLEKNNIKDINSLIKEESFNENS